MSEIPRIECNNTVSEKSNEDAVTEKTKRKMSELSKRAKAVKGDHKLRHIPNEHDLQLASDNVRFMQLHQYKSISAESEGE